jgi:lytic murein transglycosylase
MRVLGFLFTLVLWLLIGALSPALTAGEPDATTPREYYQRVALLKHAKNDGEEVWAALWATCLTPDGTLALTAGDFESDGDGIIWSTRTGALIARLNRTKPALSPEEEELRDQIRELGEKERDARQRDKLRALDRKERESEYGAINDCAATPDGKYFVTGHHRGKVALWDRKTGVLRLSLDVEGSVDRVVVARNGKQIAGAGTVGRVWNIPSGKVLADLKAAGSTKVTNILFFDDDRKVATAHNNGITGIWDATTGRPLHFLRQLRARVGNDDYFDFGGKQPAVIGLAATPSGSQIVTGGEDGSVAIWDVRSGEMRHSFTGHTDTVRRIAMSPSGEWFVTASYDKTARVWSTGTGKLLRELRGHEDKLRNVEVVANRQWVITASYDKTVRIWDVNSDPSLLTTLDERAGGHTKKVYTFASAPDGQIVVSVSSDGTGRVWRSEGGTTNFLRFLEQVWPEAQAMGVSRTTFDAALSGVEPDLTLPDLALPGKSEVKGQGEFTKTPAEYLNVDYLAALSKQGKTLLGQHVRWLEKIERELGVQRHFVLAIWGRETDFGAERSDHYAIKALATQAYLGRRKEMFRTELLYALKMLQEGVRTRQNMLSSWAGAMGLVQFMPSEYYTFALDLDGDGRKDIWGSIPDALASMANQLRSKGWVPGQSWGYEVDLPRGISCLLEGPDHAKPLSEWNKLGVVRTGSKPFPPTALDSMAFILAPAGAHGPRFLALENFLVIKRYNTSDLYALFVGNLADRIAGGGGFDTPWEGVGQLPAGTIAEIQQLLQQQGYAIGKIDGKAGMNTRSLIGAYQNDHHLTVDCWPTEALIQNLRIGR